MEEADRDRRKRGMKKREKSEEDREREEMGGIEGERPRKE